MRQIKISHRITNRDSASLDKYINDVSRLPMVLPEEEVELARRIREGDEKALIKLVSANLRFVISVAKQYQNQGLSLGDLINEGNLGLIKAALRFDETRGFKFISYAVWWIRQSIMQAIAEHARIVRLPANKFTLINKLNRIFSELEQKFEREPTAEELAQFSDIEYDELLALLQSNTKYTYLDAPLSDSEDSGNLYDVTENGEPSPEHNLMKHSLKEDIMRLLKSLNPREAKVIKLYYGLEDKHPYSLDEISEKMGLTRERVRQIKERALRKLRQCHKAKYLIAYLE
ncbi:MAG: RNA polymerase sigma factor RpoD/SigA [Flavobacteriales bacterium]|nr:RNA polymerase sigma factor RpoD/SigA [Flavobacteriales bacterium]MCX7768929.1 RNA polymerase sigma factor RpoD/SigA [Flavobacteriales bacterium]MDW8409970.1 RNA polymerase sigma factor RpoD/SigA [Flavobacteriales bacterium]